MPKHWYPKKYNSRIIRHAVQVEALTNSIPLPGLSRVTRQPLRQMTCKSIIFWFSVFLGCLAGLTYQTYDRIAFYFEYPIAVDVYNVIAPSMPYPPIMVCSLYGTPKINEEWRMADIPKDDLGIDWKCMNPYLHLMGKSNLSLTDLYFAANMSKITTEVHIQQKDKRELLDLKFGYNATPFGTCKVIELVGEETQAMTGSQVSVKFLKEDKAICETEATYFITLVPYNKFPTLKNAVTALVANRIKVWFGRTKYTFVDSPIKHCVSDEEFHDCISKCLIDNINKHLSCRFPFTPPEVNKPICKNPIEARKDYAFVLKLHGDLHPITDCHCTKSCEEYNYELNAEAVQMDNETETYKPCDTSHEDPCYTEIDLVFAGPAYTEFKERLIYTAGTLIADFGGNLGLFLGLSSLSAIQILHIIWNLKKKKITQSIAFNRMKDKRIKPIFYKVIDDEKRNSFMILTYVMFVVSVYTVYNRLYLYWIEPVNTIVTIIEADVIQYPDVILCGENTDLTDIRGGLADETNGKSCDVSPWELIGYNDLQGKQITAEQIWGLLSLESMFIPGFDAFELYSGLPRVLPFENSTVALPYGNCTQFISPHPSKYRGSWSMGSVIMETFANDDTCRPKNLIYLLAPRGDNINLLAVNDMPSLSLNAIWFQEKWVRRLNSTSNPCRDSSVYFNCRSECFNKIWSEMLPGLTCSLPYMGNSSLPFCTSSLTASLSHKSYFKAFEASITKCNCGRRCSETYYLTRVYTPAMKTPSTVYNYLYQTNLIEKYIEENAYPLSLCLSHIGSILGLTLAFDLLSFFDFAVGLQMQVSRVIVYAIRLGKTI